MRAAQATGDSAWIVRGDVRLTWRTSYRAAPDRPALHPASRQHDGIRSGRGGVGSPDGLSPSQAALIPLESVPRRRTGDDVQIVRIRRA